MRIKKMTASFGRLQNATLEPGPGLTIIQARRKAAQVDLPPSLGA